MRLRTALNEYKRRRGARFPQEAPTADGAFSAHGDRLVYVDPDGSLRDYSAPLSGLYGVDRSRLGIEADGEVRWFDDLDPVRQHYYAETTLVETEYDAGDYTVHQYDITLGRAHLTHVELRGAVPADAHLTAFLTFAPEGRETQVGRLVHEDAGPDPTGENPAAARAVEVFHHREHDYVTASTGLSDVRGQIPERFDELLAETGLTFPREAVLEKYEDTHLSGDIVVSAPLETDGRAARTTLVTQLSDHDEVDRDEALADLRNCAASHTTADDLRTRARALSEVQVADDTPRANLVREDLRALSLLTAPSGAHIAGPEFDPFYTHSGGYGYAWFRDEAEVGRNLLSAAQRLDLAVDDRLQSTARFFCDTQLDDGTWPHRAWANDGSLAPGWANARVEGALDSPEYQADQTASTVSYLATLLRERPEVLDTDLRDRVVETVVAGVDGLDATLTDEGLPERCQNCWENMDGQFTHTAATFLQAYAEVARAPLDVDVDVVEHAERRAETVFDALDALWTGSLQLYALRRDRGELDPRYDSATFALVDAFVAYDAVHGLTDADRDRLATHVEQTLDGLARDPGGSDVFGLVRFEDDTWRNAGQNSEKIWSVSTGWGVTAAARLGTMLVEAGEDERGEALLEEAANLYEALLPDGPLATQVGYLCEQVFDDGTPDSAAPLGWAHALRLDATAYLRAHDALPSTAPTPSGPDERPVWTTGEKYGVGTVADHGESEPSNVWFTLTEGALTEVRFPRVDMMNLRTLDFLVVDADEDSDYVVRTHVEDRREDDADTVERTAEIVTDDALLFRHDIAERGDGRGHEWSLTVEYASDPAHDAVLADLEFAAEDDHEYEVYALANTALTNVGATDRGIRLGRGGSYHLVARDASAYDDGTDPILTDQADEVYSVAVAMTSTERFEWGTVAVAGSERIREFFKTGERPAATDAVDNDNAILVGALGAGQEVQTTVGLGFGEEADTAAALGEAAGALARGYETVRTDYAESWRSFLEDKPVPEEIAGDDELANQYRASLMSLAAVEDKTYLGASIASPSVPWGEAVTAAEAKGYGYNFVWSRDLYQVFTVFDAVGDHETARAQLEYIYEYQQDDTGFIPQNTYLDGRTRWGGEQMDNISFPAVMAYHLKQAGIGFETADYDYDNLRASAQYVAENGPPTAQERWEEEAGYSPSSIAAEIAGLACAAALAIDEDRTGDALVWLSLADEWADCVEDWTATETGTERHDQTPYYVRITRNGDPDAGNLRTLANGGPTLDEREIIDAGFLELTRLGIKPADDEAIRNSVDVVDDTIRVDTPHGPAFYRYNGDGYGEREGDDEGAPWHIDAESKGRLWPIFTGERGEYELLAETEEGPEAPQQLLRTMAAFANEGRMLAEQVWDREHGTAYDWEFGEGTGSATPLAWSMAQFVRLAHGVDAGEPVETPDFVRERYVERDRPDAPTLRVDTDFVGDRLRVLGETDGSLVAVSCAGDTHLVEPEDGEYAVEVPLTRGENRITVAAASDAELERAATTVERLTL